MNERIASAPLPENVPLASLMSQSAKLRGAHWDALVRVVLSIRTPDDLDAQGEVVWDRVTPRDLDAPVTEDAVRAKAGENDVSLKPTNQSPYNRRKP